MVVTTYSYITGEELLLTGGEWLLTIGEWLPLLKIDSGKMHAKRMQNAGQAKRLVIHKSPRFARVSLDEKENNVLAFSRHFPGVSPAFHCAIPKNRLWQNACKTLAKVQASKTHAFCLRFASINISCVLHAFCRHLLEFQFRRMFMIMLAFCRRFAGVC